MKIIKIIIALFILISFSYTSYAQNGYQDEQQNILTFATTSFHPPFVTRAANNTYYGLDIDIALAICKVLNMQCKFQPMRFYQLLPNVNNGTVDAAIRAITITQFRQNFVNFTLPYLPSYAVFVGTKNLPSTAKVNSTYIKGKVLGAETGTLYVSYLQNKYGYEIKLKTYNDLQDAIAALKKNKIQLILMDDLTAHYWVETNRTWLKRIGHKLIIGNGYGIAVNKQNTELLNRLNNALITIEKNGTYAKIISNYYGDFRAPSPDN